MLEAERKTPLMVAAQCASVGWEIEMLGRDPLTLHMGTKEGTFSLGVLHRVSKRRNNCVEGEAMSESRPLCLYS